LLDKISKENSYRAMLKTVTSDKQEEIIQNITEKYSLIDFFSNLADKKTEFEKIIGKDNAEKIIKIIESKKEKTKEVKQPFKISDKSENGIVKIKDMLKEAKQGTTCTIRYIAAGRYTIVNEGENFKELRNQISTVINAIEQQAKKNKSFFEVEKS
jgi:translation initiation factor 2 alpha subunit (eIF-2alpha)